jgi:hypothetical protein
MLARSALKTSVRSFSSSARAERKVAVLGAGGGIGQPLSLLLKTDPLVTGLSLYDIRGAPGVAADISHVNTPAVTKGYEQAEWVMRLLQGGGRAEWRLIVFVLFDDSLASALKGAEVVVIPAGVPRKPGMTWVQVVDAMWQDVMGVDIPEDMLCHCVWNSRDDLFVSVPSPFACTYTSRNHAHNHPHSSW